MAPGTLEVAITHGMNRGSGSAGQPEGGTGERNAKMKGAVRHVRFRTSDSGCRVSTGLSNGEVTTDPGGSCWWRAGLGWEGDEGEDMSTSISLWNLGWSGERRGRVEAGGRCS